MAPKPANTAHYNIVGTSPHGEIFATGFWTRQETPPSGFQNWQDHLAGVRDILDTDDIGAPWRMLPTNAAYTELTGYFYGAGNDGSATVVGAVPYAHTGIVSNQSMPLQCALCLSLGTGLPGASRRGRMFLPAYGLGLADGQLTQADIDRFTDWWRDRFMEINAETVLEATVVVVSDKLGETFDVTEVTADSRLDIQRRRANGETELRQASAPLS